MFLIREARIEDLAEMLDIYNFAVLNLNATFDVKKQTLEERTKWFHKYGGKYPLIVAEDFGKVIGYTSLSTFKEKDAYASTAELSIYISPDYHGKGVGSILMRDILERAAMLGYHSIISSIASGNNASMKLHEKFGFQYTGTLREVGWKFGQWQDINYYQLIIPVQIAAGANNTQVHITAM